MISASYYAVLSLIVIARVECTMQMKQTEYCLMTPGLNKDILS